MDETGTQNQTAGAATLPAVLSVLPVAAEPPLESYARVGPYALIEAIAKGGTGVVWRALHVTLRQVVAVKVLDRRPDTAAGQRFLREARTGARLRHRYATAVHNAGIEPDGTLWLAMDLVVGETVWHFVKTRGPMPLPALVHFLGCLGEVLGVAHQLGIAHRDVSPGNVMVTLDGALPEPRLLDLGLARWMDEAPFTEQNIGMGTPGYVSPEQRVNAADAGPLADLYSLGRLTTFLLTGQPELTSPMIPAPLVPVLARATDPEPAHRQADVAGFVRELRAAAAPLLDAERHLAAEPACFVDRFGSPGPFQDLRDAAAQQLFRRSAGLPRWADGELRRAEGRDWVALDADDGMWRADPSGLCAWRLDAPPRGERAERVERRPQLSDDGRRLLGILALAGGELHAGLVDAATLPPARRDLAIHELARFDQARRVPGTDLLICPAETRLPAPWTPDAQAGLHAGIVERAKDAAELDVLRQGYRAAMRLGDGDTIAAAADRLVQRLLVTEGLVEATLAVMHAAEALIDSAPAAAAALVPLATELVFSEPLPEGVARIEALLARIDAPVAAEARALFAARTRIVTGRAREGIDLPDELSHPLLTAQAWRTRVYAALQDPAAGVGAVLARAEGWFNAHWDDGDLASLYLQLRGQAAYRQGHFHEAAALAAAALEPATRVDRKVDANTAAAAAYLELGLCEAARREAAAAIAQARGIQSPQRLVRATSPHRQALLNLGAPIEPRPDLAANARAVAAFAGANVTLIEAAIAMRTGRVDVALQMAQEAGVSCRKVDAGTATILADALVLHLGGAVDPGPLLRQCRRAVATADTDSARRDLGLVLQALALIAPAAPDQETAAVATECAARLRDPRPQRVRELYSTADALRICTGPHPPSSSDR